MKIVWKSKQGSDDGTMSMEGPMKVQQLGPPRDARVDAANLALALANYRGQRDEYAPAYEISAILLDAEKFFMFLTDDRVAAEVTD